eukprot:1525757-Amphidinium_carterae.1
MEEIFLDMVMTMTSLKMMMLKAMDRMVIEMPIYMAGAIYARRNAYQLRNVSGVAVAGRESCMPSV